MNLNAKKSSAYNRLRELADACRSLGTVAVDAAVEKCTRYLDKRMQSELGRHERTGAAMSTHRVESSRRGWRMVEKAYVLAGNFKPGSKAKGKGSKHIEWSFFNGTPISALNYMRKQFGLEVVKRLGGS